MSRSPQMWIAGWFTFLPGESLTGMMDGIPPQVDVRSAAISFPNWRACLAEAPLETAGRHVFRRELLAFLHFCKVARAPESVRVGVTQRVWEAAHG
jgi:hypothetical protein